MFFLAILLTTIVVGYISGLKRKRLSVFKYMLAAFLGAIVGGLLSLGDSKLFLDYPIFNIWTVPFIFSVFAALIATFADRGKMLITIVLIVLMLAGAIGIVYMDSTGSDDSAEALPSVSTELEREEATR